jgi:hypothetical protein
MSEANIKRERMSNWTNGEQITLIDLVLEQYDFLPIKQSNTEINLLKQARWSHIVNSVNAAGQQCRNVKQIKEKWDNLKAAAKTEFTADLTYARGTGGGPRRRPIPVLLLPIIERLKDTPSFCGLVGVESQVVVLGNKHKTVHTSIVYISNIRLKKYCMLLLV